MTPERSRPLTRYVESAWSVSHFRVHESLFADDTSLILDVAFGRAMTCEVDAQSTVAQGPQQVDTE